MNRVPYSLEECRTEIYVKQDILFDIPKRYYAYRNHREIDKVYDICGTQISRAKVINIFKEGDLVVGFYAAMIWGGVSACDGPKDWLFEILKISEDKLNNIITHVSGLLADDKIVEAFRYMEKEGKVKGLGESYFTKLFFFLSEANNNRLITPIFDKWTKLAFCALLIELEELTYLDKYALKYENFEVTFSNCSRANIYEDYVNFMNHCGKTLNVSISNLELHIFGHDRRKDKSWSNLRIIYGDVVKSYFRERVKYCT